MNTACPHCQHPLSKKDLFVRAKIACPHCKQLSCYGNFWQWLAAAVSALVITLMSLVGLQQFGGIWVLILSMTLGLSALGVAMIFLIKPVPYQAPSWLSNTK